jgi:hypothetical protein
MNRHLAGPTDSLKLPFFRREVRVAWTLCKPAGRISRRGPSKSLWTACSRAPKNWKDSETLLTTDNKWSYAPRKRHPKPYTVGLFSCKRFDFFRARCKHYSRLPIISSATSAGLFARVSIEILRSEGFSS